MLHIIVYHLIGTPSLKMTDQEKRMYVSAEIFQSHICFLKDKGYSFISLEEAEHLLKSQKGIQENKVLVTFDDGYCNTIDIAMPILKEAGVPAAMSICGSYINPETRRNIQMHVDKNFADADRIKKWIACGNAILAHTYSHNKLTCLSRDMCEQEIFLDYEILGKTFGFYPRGIVYPYGSFDEQVLSIAEKYYEYGFATDMGYQVSWDNRYRLKRICAESNCFPEHLYEQMIGESEKYCEDSFVLA